MANNTRNAIDAALFAQLFNAYKWKTASQHFASWENYQGNQPAMFLRRIAEEEQQTKAYGLQKYIFKYECWVYVQVQSNDATQNPYAILNPIIDAIDSAIGANPVSGRNNLVTTAAPNGLVDNVRIDGTILIADGTDNGQAVIRIPISVFTGI